MSHFSEVWRKKRSHLINDYRDESGEYVDHCYFVAEEIAHALQADGQQPKIYSIRGREMTTGHWLGRESLVPRPYEGRVSWDGHFLGVSAGLAYDPILAAPILLNEYAIEAFGQPVEVVRQEIPSA